MQRDNAEMCLLHIVHSHLIHIQFRDVVHIEQTRLSHTMHIATPFTCSSDICGS